MCVRVNNPKTSFGKVPNTPNEQTIHSEQNVQKTLYQALGFSKRWGPYVGAQNNNKQHVQSVSDILRLLTLPHEFTAEFTRAPQA